ncbi:unnamed protein product [Notodromas monacha]|uniref:t-SNARE coiled-coil homology domain-containing protein n=1 Tax=Notodromas monacha TaxID=399045 RepID=A0A7R9BWN7_9CRUS|nr:unnamed protein product [Notodromas monacha]CAG0922031.1 unnamed protein product [Notodromas monacha]
MGRSDAGPTVHVRTRRDPVVDFCRNWCPPLVGDGKRKTVYMRFGTFLALPFALCAGLYFHHNRGPSEKMKHYYKRLDQIYDYDDDEHTESGWNKSSWFLLTMSVLVVVVYAFRSVIRRKPELIPGSGIAEGLRQWATPSPSANSPLPPSGDTVTNLGFGAGQTSPTLLNPEFHQRRLGSFIVQIYLMKGSRTPINTSNLGYLSSFLLNADVFLSTLQEFLRESPKAVMMSMCGRCKARLEHLCPRCYGHWQSQHQQWHAPHDQLHNNCHNLREETASETGEKTPVTLDDTVDQEPELCDACHNVFEPFDTPVKKEEGCGCGCGKKPSSNNRSHSIMSTPVSNFLGIQKMDPMFNLPGQGQVISSIQSFPMDKLGELAEILTPEQIAELCSTIGIGNMLSILKSSCNISTLAQLFLDSAKEELVAVVTQVDPMETVELLSQGPDLFKVLLSSLGSASLVHCLKALGGSTFVNLLRKLTVHGVTAMMAHLGTALFIKSVTGMGANAIANVIKSQGIEKAAEYIRLNDRVILHDSMPKIPEKEAQAEEANNRKSTCDSKESNQFDVDNNSQQEENVNKLVSNPTIADSTSQPKLEKQHVQVSTEALHKCPSKQLQKDTSALAQLTKTLMHDLQRYIMEHKENKVARLQFDRLAENFASALHDFQEYQRDIVTQERTKCEENRCFLSGDTGTRAPLVDHHEPSTLQHELLLDNDTESLEERRLAMQSLEREIREVNDIFKDLATLVHEQGDVMDSIEASIETGDLNLVRGLDDLERARRKANQRRTRKVMIFGTIAGVLALVIVVIPIGA